MLVVVTGSTGRLGRAVVRGIPGGTGWTALAWTRADFDLDAPSAVGATLDRDHPDLIVHCAAWTDVDGCARDPDLAARRNGFATGGLAEACADRGIGMLAISTNEVFDGRRTDHQPYRPTDPPAPPNAYGRSKLLGEEQARTAFSRAGAGPLWIVRTAWLFGPPGNDFPMKILAAARSAQADGRSLRLVADEIGSPTYAPDLAAAVCDLLAHPASAGLHHVVNTGIASRAAWARKVLEETGIEVDTEDVPASTWERASNPPRWGVLEPTALPTLGRLRSWRHALSEYLAVSSRSSQAARASS